VHSFSLATDTLEFWRFPHYDEDAKQPQDKASAARERLQLN
jgi:hypothetical protein